VTTCQWPTLHCSTQNLTRRRVQLADRESRLSSLLAKLARVMSHRSLLLATAPQMFPGGGLGSCACLAEECGFARVDTVRGSGAATPGKCRRCSVRDWQPAKTGSAPTLPQRDLCGYTASPGRVFSSPVRGTGCGVLLLDRVRSSKPGRFPSYNIPRKRRVQVQKGCLRSEEEY